MEASPIERQAHYNPLDAGNAHLLRLEILMNRYLSLHTSTDLLQNRKTKSHFADVERLANPSRTPQ
ncbi:hypothetical protein D3C76_1147460 [compost metagenome]